MADGERTARTPTSKERPRRPARVAGRGPALALAIAVHVAFIAVLIFSIRWQNRAPEPVTAELYAPPAAVVEPPRPAPVPEPEPPPKVEPVPEPKAETAPPPKPEPLPPPNPAPKIEPKIDKPDPRADIALKAKQDAERRQREEAERAMRERELKEAQKREAERKKAEEEKRLADAREKQKALDAQKARERQQKEIEAQKQQALQERQKRLNDELLAQAKIETQAREAEARAQAQRQALAAEQQRIAAARQRSFDGYVARIRDKIRGNVILPGDIAGNPEALFEVVQLPTGEIIDVKLVKSSGLRAYDDAVQRAIYKSSPLPKPDQPDLWQRSLALKFRPKD